MQREATICFVTVVALTALTVATLAGQGEGGEYRWNLPPGVPPPRVPADAQMTAAGVELGRYLFYDTRLSGNGTQSCATCHRQALAFTDGRPRSVGSTGDRHPRSSMSLANVAYRDALTWANPTLRSLEEQALVPMLGTDPVELGLAGHEVRVRAELAALPIYQRFVRRGVSGARTVGPFPGHRRAIGHHREHCAGAGGVPAVDRLLPVGVRPPSVPW